MKPPDPAPIVDLIEAFRRSKTMFAATSLGVFDLLAAGPKTAREIAGQLATDADATARLLEACEGLGLLVSIGGQFANTELANAYLVQTSEHALTGYIQYSNDALIALWSHLEDAIREGTPRWQQTFGLPGPIFDQFFSTGAKMRTFIQGMHGFGVLSSPSVVRAFDLGEFQTIADLGGATGHLTVAACEAWPQMHGIVFDMEKVVAVAREYVAKSEARDRISFQAGDFFTDPLPPANLYALGRILHDWTEDKIRLLVARIFKALPSGGGLLLAEKLLYDDKSGPVHAQMQSLNMLVCTEGKERTLNEYRELLEAAGFQNIEGKRTGKAVDAVLGRKP